MFHRGLSVRERVAGRDGRPPAGHEVEGLTRAFAGLKDAVDSQPGSLGTHFHSALEHYEQKHTHLSDVLAPRG